MDDVPQEMNSIGCEQGLFTRISIVFERNWGGGACHNGLISRIVF